MEIHYHRQQNIRDLPYRDKQVILKIDIRRFKCRECGK
ncbi:MAG: transposase family protein, partial [Peptoniphilus harei]|nr:transposase family protein [Peptoniphilus harei]